MILVVANEKSSITDRVILSVVKNSVSEILWWTVILFDTPSPTLLQSKPEGNKLSLDPQGYWATGSETPGILMVGTDQVICIVSPGSSGP